MVECSHMKDNEVKIRVSGEMKDRWQKSALDKGITLSKYIIDRVEGVPTKEKVNVPTNIDVPTEDEEVVITDLESLKREIKGAMERGERENWVRVRELVNQAGYSWDATTQILTKDGREVWKGYLDNL